MTNAPMDYTALVEQARGGNRQAMEALAEGIRGRLYAYVYRIVLREHLAQDITQETLLEMFKVLGKLQQADRFWPWLRAIAFNKIRRHHSKLKQHREAVEAGYSVNPGDYEQSEMGLTGIVADELRQLVLGAMSELKPSQRKVLTMRCYEDMDYGDIAQLMGCSELSARVAFCRAKKSLERALSRRGFHKGFLVTALIVFGKITAPGEAAAATISITAATTSAGATAGLIALAGSKAAVVSIAAAGAVAAGVVLMPGGADTSASGSDPSLVAASRSMVAEAERGGESWFFYPLSPDGPVMMRQFEWDDNGQPCARSWQDDRANYAFDRRRNTISMNNHHPYNGDLSVMRLPTDAPALTDFLTAVEGPMSRRMEYVSASGQGLLVIAARGQNGDGRGAQIIRHYNVLDEEYSMYQWPSGAALVDNRDTMHRRGWTYFRVSGHIGEDAVNGTGRLPLVCGLTAEQYPWLRLRVGNKYSIIDDASRARVFDGRDELIGVYPGLSFFDGLSRPWMGIHSIDSVRRDAAMARCRFETENSSDTGRVQVRVSCHGVTLTYSIDMEKDLVTSISLTPRDASGRPGVLSFSYMQEVDETVGQFETPRQSISERPQQTRLGILWLDKCSGATL